MQVNVDMTEPVTHVAAESASHGIPALGGKLQKVTGGVGGGSVFTVGGITSVCTNGLVSPTFAANQYVGSLAVTERAEVRTVKIRSGNVVLNSTKGPG